MTMDTAPVLALGSRRSDRPSVKTAAALSSSTEAKHALRLAAMAADASGSAEMSLSLFWRELSRGVSHIVEGFFSDERCYLLLSPRTAGPATPMDARRLEILEAVLSGLRQKNIAIDLTLAPSTVALNSRLALEYLGVAGKPSRAHPLLMLAAKAARDPSQVSARCSSFISADQRELRVISTARPDLALAARLPSAELAVIRSLVEGLSYQEIARLRGTSTRTIANQISAVFRRLRVSGRNELVQRLFFDEALGKPSSEPELERETLIPPPIAAAEARSEALQGTLRSA
jgi:DNA-binding NarL/FixJ family response regulator